MRPGEWLLFVLLIAGWLLLLRPGGRWWRPAAGWLLLASGPAVLAHIFLETARWQMIPAYGLLIFVALLLAWRLRRSDSPVRGGFLFWSSAAVLLLFILAAAAPPLAVPIPNLPEPAGPYPVGTWTTTLVDPNRPESYTPAPDDLRAIVVQAWYPAAVVDDPPDPAPLIPQAERVAAVLSDRLGFPPFALNHLNLIKANGRPELPAAPLPAAEAQGRPIILFSPGYSSSRLQSTTLMEELASHGYVVLAVDHTFGGVMTIFPDGRIEFLSPEAQVGDRPELRPSTLRLSDVWTADLFQLLDLLPAYRDGELASPLAGQLDLERIGFLGHSTGAGVAARLCAVDDRCRALLGMDVWMGPLPDELLARGTARPTLFLMSESWPSAYNSERIRTYMAASPDSLWLTVRSTAHYNFTDIPFLSPLTSRLEDIGPADPYRIQAVNAAYLTAFFDQHLRGRPSPLLETPQPDFPEVIYE